MDALHTCEQRLIGIRLPNNLTPNDFALAHLTFHESLAGLHASAAKLGLTLEGDLDVASYADMTAQMASLQDEEFGNVTFRLVYKDDMALVLGVFIEPQVVRFWEEFDNVESLQGEHVLYVRMSRGQQPGDYYVGRAYCLGDTPSFFEDDEVNTQAAELFGPIRADA